MNQLLFSDLYLLPDSYYIDVHDTLQEETPQREIRIVSIEPVE